MDAFFNGEPKSHFSVGEFDTSAWEWVERFQVLQEPPLRFGVILGDCLHNLRSCLDHITWQVTLLDGGTPNKLTQYPIASESEAQFEAMANRRIPGLNARHRAMVKKTQPSSKDGDYRDHRARMAANAHTYPQLPTESASCLAVSLHGRASRKVAASTFAIG